MVSAIYQSGFIPLAKHSIAFYDKKANWMVVAGYKNRAVNKLFSLSDKRQNKSSDREK